MRDHFPNALLYVKESLQSPYPPPNRFFHVCDTKSPPYLFFRTYEVLEGRQKRGWGDQVSTTITMGCLVSVTVVKVLAAGFRINRCYQCHCRRGSVQVRLIRLLADHAPSHTLIVLFQTTPTLYIVNVTAHCNCDVRPLRPCDRTQAQGLVMPAVVRPL